MDQWLRPVFKRTPVLASPSATTQPSIDDSQEGDEAMPRYQASRVSSMPDAFVNMARNPENLYHKPSVDQMAETLKVVMMNRPTLDPIPVEYNSSILHVLEAYQDLREQLNTKEQDMEAVRQSQTQTILDFEGLASQWETKEREYSAEIKKLEGPTEGGMESVTLARSCSSIHGSRKASETLRKGIGKIRQIAEHNRPVKEPKYNPEGLGQDRHNFGYGILQEHKIREIDSKADILTKAKLQVMERERSEQRLGIAFESSTESTSQSAQEDNHLSTKRQLVHSLCEKPLPDIPTYTDELIAAGKSSSNANNVHPWVESDSQNNLLSSQRGFSFRPGDDRVLDESVAGFETPSNRKELKTRKSKANLQSKTSEQGKPPKMPREVQPIEPPKRVDSASSILTAIRDNSGRGSANEHERERLFRDTKSREAIVAANRAVAASKKNSFAPGGTQ
ncbi:hypothetical protein B7494_g8056 [Chlorociboria aeruginascens]|nr:hypothetical protein B7494_g8056 [Chlorociboria aeruginascens]